MTSPPWWREKIMVYYYLLIPAAQAQLSKNIFYKMLLQPNKHLRQGKLKKTQLKEATNSWLCDGIIFNQEYNSIYNLLTGELDAITRCIAPLCQTGWPIGLWSGVGSLCLSVLWSISRITCARPSCDLPVIDSGCLTVLDSGRVRWIIALCRFEYLPDCMSVNLHLTVWLWYEVVAGLPV